MSPFVSAPTNGASYRPAFAPPAPPARTPSYQQQHNPLGQRSPFPSLSHKPPPPPPPHASTSKAVIDLTSSRTPSPQAGPSRQPVQGPHPSSILPPDLSPKTPICIGQLSVTALVLYPVPFLNSAHPNQPNAFEDWAPIRLIYEHTPKKAEGSETIHIRVPIPRENEIPAGEPNETFAVVEQKVATVIGPTLQQGHIRLEGKIRRGLPGLPILPLQLLVYTPLGNIPTIGNYLQSQQLLLDHPTPPYDTRFQTSYYHNPHNPPPGGHKQAVPPPNRFNYASRWNTASVPGKSVEVQRTQVDQLFKTLKNGASLPETMPNPNIGTTLYSHQKKALTFLLLREREITDSEGKFSSLWDARKDIRGNKVWVHLVTEKETFEEPVEAKGAILADDMGLGKTITCVSLIAATMDSAQVFTSHSTAPPPQTPPDPGQDEVLPAAHFSGRVWGMPEVSRVSLSAKDQAKATREQEKREEEYTRACRIKARSRATLIICPLSTVSNWEDQLREHWKGSVSIYGGSCPTVPLPSASTPTAPSTPSSSSHAPPPQSTPMATDGPASMKVYIYHGNARRPDPLFLADFDVVITTYATLASEFSKQNRSTKAGDEEEEEGGSTDDAGGVDFDEKGNAIIRLPKSKATKPLKRKKSSFTFKDTELSSALQSVHWFRVVLDEAHSIKETQTVASRACCDLMADRRLCITGTPVQNKLDDVYALVKFLRLTPFDDKHVWTEYVGGPVKYGHAVGVTRLQTIMACITLRRTKETRAEDGRHILSLPPRKDELRFLKFDEREQNIYDQWYKESKEQFAELSDKNEVMKNYVGILQKILRLRQICDHYELVEGKGGNCSEALPCYDDVIASISRDGIDAEKATIVFGLLKGSATAQCVECGCELVGSSDGIKDEPPADGTSTSKRGRKVAKSSSSRTPTRANSPAGPRPVLTRCQHLFCLECYRSCIFPGWPVVPADAKRCCSACQTGLAATDAVEIRAEEPPTGKKKQARKEKRQKMMIAPEDFHPSTKIKALLTDLIAISQENPHSPNYAPAADEVQMFDGDGKNLGISKTVVFSQWTTMLDKIEDALELAQIKYDRLDGTMRREDRTKAMDALKNDPSCEVLLVSLKAGGVGLNLTAAQRVYLMDPYWNPAVENQAVDRIHRLGQTRPVTTIKLIIENSIEARLLEVQKKKTELANLTLNQPSKSEMMTRRMEELQQLFQ